MANITAADDDKNFVSVPFSRTQAEREVLMDLMAMRDERNLAQIDSKDRDMFTEEAIGRVAQMDLQEMVAVTARIKPTASFSQGVLCKGTVGFTKGVTCKLVLKKG